jgi:hypothetical protein
MRMRSGLGILVLVAACGPLEGAPGGTSSGSGLTTSTGDTAAVEGTTMVAGVTTSGVDDGPWLDLPPDVGADPYCNDWPSEGCGMPSARGTVMGTTPLGDFETTRAVFSSVASCGVCSNLYRIVLLGDSVAIEDLEPSGSTDETLMIEPSRGLFDGPVGQPVGARLYASRGGAQRATTVDEVAVEMVIDVVPTDDELTGPFDPRAAVVVTGSVTAEGDGWSVTGTFAASYCPDLNAFPTCE